MRALAFLTSSCLVVALSLIGCGQFDQDPYGNRPNYGQVNPTPTPTPPAENYAARFQVGAVERVFTQNQAEGCSLAATVRGGAEALQILFVDRSSNSSLKLRIGNFQRNQSYVSLESNNTNTGNLALSLGGDEQRYMYRLSNGNNARCQIQYTVQNDSIQGALQCDRLANSLGETQAASGNFSCRFERYQF